LESPAGPKDRDQHDGAAQVSARNHTLKRRARVGRPLQMPGSYGCCRPALALAAHTWLSLRRADLLGCGVSGRLQQRCW
jgi:hypothetical protein